MEKYFIAKKYSATTGSDHNGDKGENFYFDLIHADSISSSTHWEEVDRKDCDYYHYNWMHKRIKSGNETFMILDKKTYSGPHHQCSFLLQKINGPVEARFMTEPEYDRFEKGDTFHIEKHKGVLGVEWLTYR
ncbi:hypothetical protein GFS24_05730 [Chitinophaga sp. SYP-B3965]|uniref:hypothetical protein n=1 Tax=Chitinophaga sp. SYP-B3965 TaxID=2663120 RepID=UPI0012996CE6|nr:hypothetical protein [Chitinophaga sp. SYP-B3965]MRG44602.1 hypothetical protein [Chitinophaga sp. SYP-B3965]